MCVRVIFSLFFFFFFNCLLGGSEETWTADRHMLGFLPTPRFSQSNSVHILKTNPSDETVNPVPQCAYAWRKITYVKDHMVHVRVG